VHWDKRWRISAYSIQCKKKAAAAADIAQAAIKYLAGAIQTKEL
jgi:hypothetical protein